MTAKRHLPVHPHRFIEKLIEAGILQEGELIRHLVIEVKPRQAVTMYIERYADERLLNVLTTLEGIKVETGPEVTDEDSPGPSGS